MARRARTTSLANQERAYTAASRRTDRSIEARWASAEAASELHRQRTGRSLYITRDIILRDEIYEEVDDLAWRRLHRHGNMSEGLNCDTSLNCRHNYIQEIEAEKALQTARTIKRELNEIESRYNAIDCLFHQCFAPQTISSPPTTQHQELPDLVGFSSPPDVDYSAFVHDVTAPIPSSENQAEQDLDALNGLFESTSVLTAQPENLAGLNHTCLASTPPVSWGPPSPSPSPEAPMSATSLLPLPYARIQEAARDSMSGGTGIYSVEPANLQLYTDTEKTKCRVLEQNEATAAKMAGFESPSKAVAMAAAVGSDWDRIYPDAQK